MSEIRIIHLDERELICLNGNINGKRIPFGKGFVCFGSDGTDHVISLHLDDGTLCAAKRFYPYKREGRKVFFRTESPAEKNNLADFELEVDVDEVLFGKGDVHFTSEDIDSYAKALREGDYWPLTHAIVSSMRIVLDEEDIYPAWNLCKKLDAAFRSWVRCKSYRNSSFTLISPIDKIYANQALLDAETAVVSLYGACRQAEKFGLDNRSFGKAFNALKALRDSIEHSDERARGKSDKKDKKEDNTLAYDFFKQDRFFTEGILTYGHHSLDMTKDFPDLLFRLKNELEEICDKQINELAERAFNFPNGIEVTTYTPAI